MTIVNGYATLQDVKTYLNVTGATEDVRLSNAIESASRAIDTWTRRRFYAVSGVRYFSGEADFGRACLLDEDLLTVTEIATDDQNTRVYSPWLVSDYELEPINSGPPFTQVRVAPLSVRSFPIWPRGVRLTGTWGYSATAPQAVNEACVMLAARYFKRKDAPFGVVGTPELGFMRVTPKDTDVMALLKPFVRVEVMGV
jgi:hypothetical protein